MRKLYKNFVNTRIYPDPIERRMNMVKEALHKGTPAPKPVEYEDIDDAFEDWVNKKLDLSYDGKRIPTMTQYSNQRFSEYLQTWQYTDENNNIILNFKTVNREKNPQQGSQYEKYYNVPGERFYLMARQISTDEAGRHYFTDYKMKQPYNADLVYRVSIVADKIQLLNDFNEKLLAEFKSKQSYIAPNGYYMSMVLDNISDESKYNVDDRQFFSQTATITLRAYIIRKEDMRVEETPVLGITFMGDGAKQKRPLVTLAEDLPDCNPDEPDDRYYETLTLDFDICGNDRVNFNTRENNLDIYYYETVNVRWWKMSVNDGEWVQYKPECPDEFMVSIPENTGVKVIVKKNKVMGNAKIILSAFDPAKTSADYLPNDDGIREFRPQGEDDKPLEIVDD